MRAMFRALWGGFKTHAFALLALIGVGVALALVLLGGVYVASQRPEFCVMCHYMEPFYRQWKTSTHAEVSCVSCHPVRPVTIAVSAARYATETYDPKPRAEVPNRLCLQSGCHGGRLLEGASTFKGKIHFNHTTHLTRLRRGKRLQCTSCHSEIVQGEHIAVTEETCFLCHFKGVGEGQAIGGCTNCHGTPKEPVRHEGFIFSHDSYLKVGVACQQCHLDVTEGDGRVPKDRCFSCHVERLEQYDNSELIHARHVTEHGVDCFRCHEKIKHGEIRMIRALEPTCENCHKDLHSPQKEMYLGSGGEGVGDTPSRMFAAQVSCDGCHTRVVHIGTPEFDEASLEAQRQSCVTCHGKGYDLMLDDWLREMDRLVRSLGPEVARAEAELKRAERHQADRVETRLLVEKARHNYDFIKFGRGVHNVEYAVKLARAATGYVDRAMSQMRPDYRPPKRSRTISTPDGYCTVLCHARLGLPEETRFERLTFPHAVHVEDLEIACTRCHSPEKHKMRVITRSECMACHHEAEDIACGHCHPAQNALYTGRAAAWGAEGSPDVMAEGEVPCVGCHDLSAPMSLAGVREMCVDCHEAGYDEMLGEWINEIQEALGRVRLLAADARRDIQAARRQGRAAAEAEGLLGQAERLIELVEKGKGVHNYALSSDMLDGVDKKLRRALALLAQVP